MPKKIGGAAIEKLPSGSLRVRLELPKDPKTGKRRWKSITAPDYQQLMSAAAPYLVDR